MEKWLEKERRQKETLTKQNRILHRHNLRPDQRQFSIRMGRFLAEGAEKLGRWTYDFVRSHWLGIINIHIFLFLVGALEAPLLLHLEQPWLSKLVYGFYGFFCHQEPSRSLFLFGNQVAICSRCLSFYSSVLFFGLWVSLKRSKPLNLKTAGLLITPAVADVLLQVLGIKESTNLIRVTTGGLLGLAVSLYLFPRAQRAMLRLKVGQHG